MAEQLGGSRGRNDNLGGAKFAMSKGASMQGTRRMDNTGSILGGGGGRPMTARGGLGGMPGGSPIGGMRPTSAPRERPSPNHTKMAYTPTKTGAQDARARVEELRQVKEADYWGRQVPIKRDLPAYWSTRTFGQPFNDERLFTGATNFYQILDPAGLKAEEARVVGPATEQAATLRKSLQDGRRYFNPTDMSPVRAGERVAKLEEPDRVLVLSKLTPYQRIHALRNCLDRNVRAEDFVPWTQMVWDRLDAKFWKRNKEMAVRLAVQKLESLMKRHLHYLSEQKCQAARAPAARMKDILREAFWKVDPTRTGTVSLQQFLQVWQNVLLLLEYEDTIVALPNGKTRVVLRPGKRMIMDLNMCAGIFVKYGFDKDGLMPYVVFSNALCASPARLLGQEVLLDKAEEGRHGLASEVDVAYCVGDAKIIYPKCKTGVFPPSGFDPRVADRSRVPPRAHMWLEHVYGYAGEGTLCTNMYYTHRTRSDNTEVVYYSGCVGVVFDKEDFDAGKPCQRFFYGHDNDIQCLTMHPSRKYVATGQQKATGPNSVPFVCIWDVDNCNLLQRLDHLEEERAVIAACFSGNMNAFDDDKKGGDLLVTVTSDDKHTIHIWRWMNNADKFCKAVNVPGWCFGPDKKLEGLKTHGALYRNPENKDEDGNVKAWLKEQSEEDLERYLDKVSASGVKQPLLERVSDVNNKVIADWELGFCSAIPPAKNDGTFTLMCEMPGCNGTPPMIYGVAWNPLRPQDGRRGSEFVSYGVKHLKTWIVNDQEQWQGSMGSFGTDHIENVLSACYVPALHHMAAPGDSCLLTGFASGQIGLWVPPYPTRAGSTYQLTRKFDAHGPGKLMTLNDGSQHYGGVRVIKLRADPEQRDPVGRVVMTGGSDGYVIQWQLEEVLGTRKDGTPLRGVNLRCLSTGADEHAGPNRFRLEGPTAPYEANDPCSVVALDCHPAKPAEFVAGTTGCDIWEVDDSPRVLVEGHEEDIYTVASHPNDPDLFATACGSGKVRIWNSKKRDVIRSAAVGFAISGLAFSNESYFSNIARRSSCHLAVGSAGSATLGSWHRIGILDAETLQPLKVLMDPTDQIDELKYSPTGGPGFLAAGCNDMRIYIYNASKEYQLVCKCVGHSGIVEHIDWSLPISQPGSKLHGQVVLQATDASSNLLYWDPRTGKKIAYNQRDAPWHTWTCRLGFPVMGIWPDDSDRTDINAVSRSQLGGPRFVPPKGIENGTASPADMAAGVETAAEDESGDGVPGCGYLVTADDFSAVRLFNYPCVWDDAPYKAFRGHASHVMCARFNADDRLVLSAGGHDRGIYQWRTCGVNREDQQADRLILAAWRLAIDRRKNADDVMRPKPGVEWGPMDEAGKVFGPTAVAQAIKEQDPNATGTSLAGTLQRNATAGRSVNPGGVSVLRRM